MKKIGFAVVSLALGAGLSHAQIYGQKQNQCIVESTDSNGNVVYTNGNCSYKVHVVWARGNQRWDNYLEAGEVHPTENKGPFSFYTCQMGYLVVDQFDRAISHEVTEWACRKQ